MLTLDFDFEYERFPKVWFSIDFGVSNLGRFVRIVLVFYRDSEVLRGGVNWRVLEECFYVGF